MKNIAFTLTLILAFISNISSQETIDGNISFQSVDKSYSIYVPSNYDPAVPNALMLGLHPLNPSRWNGEAWRDTLIVFAETNKLLLVCPDGGADGRIDDDIDTSFTSFLLDSMELWYNVDVNEKYAMGFSWGGRTTYTYGLRRGSEFKGLMAIGAAVDISVIQDVVGSAKDENIYIVHGDADTPNTRYTPIKSALEDNGACLESTFLQGVGHTIDFPNRNQILTDAFIWLQENSCGISDVKENILDEITFYPNPNSGTFTISESPNIHSIQITNAAGEKVSFNHSGQTIKLDDASKGLYLIQYVSGKSNKTAKILVH